MLNNFKYFRRKILVFYINFGKFLSIKFLPLIFKSILFKRFWKDLFFYNLIDNHEQVNVLKDGINYNFYSLSLMTKTRYNTFFTKEPGTIKWIDEFENGKTLWDIGSNVGLYSIYYGKKNSTNQVVSFEPSLFNLEILSRNIVLNNLSSNIAVFPLPLNIKNEINDFNMNNTDYGGALSGFGVDYDENFEKREINFKYKTFGINLDTLVDIYNLDFPEYIKIDVDGIENLILKGAKNVFSNDKLKSVLIENPNNDENINSFFLKNSFVLSKTVNNNQIWYKEN